ncbi:MAG TPA: hypothetical protein VGB05_09070 [Pyrinomonadaceae bacterium]
MTQEQLTWALLAPVRPVRLTTLAKEYWREEVGDDEDFKQEGWEMIEGERDYSAILDRNPGSEATHELPLAEKISRAVKRPVYVLYLDEDYAEVDAVAVFEGGRQTGSRPAPYAFARSLGLTLPGDPAAGTDAEGENEDETATTPVGGVMVVEGVGAADVARALDVSMPTTGPLHIEDGPVGAILYNVETGAAPTFMWPLSTAFPGNDVYTLSTGPDEGRFLAWVMRGGEKAGTFDFPVPSDPAAGPVLNAVKGETTPSAIAAALGVSTDILNLQEF